MFTQSEAWYEIFINYTNNESCKCSLGICHTIYLMKFYKEISDIMYSKINKIIHECLPSNSAYFCNYSKENRKLRADWCYFQYLSCLKNVIDNDDI